MKKIIFALLVTALFTACQKEDENGDLGGFWKIIRLDDLAVDNENTDISQESRFWAIQLNLLEIRLSKYDRHYSRFQLTGDSLFVQTIDDNTNLKAYGIYNNADERYKVLQLSNRSMMLRSKYAEITFRKV